MESAPTNIDKLYSDTSRGETHMGKQGNYLQLA